ncbi:type VI-B CRISPR-associated RNA-guided ribonuclease Cas13b [Halosquirtibacter xylanolyticus]|uniref:type VI-B CRISPR-associated RNA-guided ribonuclease Cas13b n=1 Tax=Halosquirtibacter xylanolyticus TaxID=3374599 RepID=UPI0037485A7A|nr:type VI-B CRISPR-associated RNA-guided ribonuclease Cas13b [Prolixibacteraceae bacterium]
MNNKTHYNKDSEKFNLTEPKAKAKYTIYFNLAIHHIENGIKEIHQRTSLGVKEGKRFKTLYNSNMALSDKEKLFRAIENYFPLVVPVRAYYEKDKRSDGINIHEKVFKALDLILERLNALRNNCSHGGYNQPIPYNKDVIESLLPDLFKRAIYREKNKRANPLACPYPFSKAQSDDFKKEVHHIREQYTHMTDQEVREEFLDQQIEHFEQNEFDIHKCCNGKRAPKDSLGLNDLFLLMQFLDKKKAEELLSQETGFKDTSKIYYQFTRWAFTSFCFRGLRNKVASHHENIRIPLMMQMVDYLSCVPDALYRHLTEAQKEEFVMDLNDYFSPYSGNHIENKLVSHLVVRKRYEDKFPYFAIRFIDEVIQPKGIRFQVYAGNHLKDRREKDMDGKVLSREIKTPIYLFERLSTVCRNKEALQTSDANSKSLELFPNPSYHIEDRKICLAIKGKDKKKTTSTKTNNTYYGSELKNDIRNKLSDSDTQKEHWTHCVISTHDLVAWLHMLLKQEKQTDKDVSQACFASWINGRHMALGHLIKNEESKDKILPKPTEGLENDVKRCHSYIELLSFKRWKKQHKTSDTEEEVDKEACIKQIHKRVADRQQRLKDLGDKRFLSDRIRGTLASWTADQLVRWMPKNVRSEWKGYHHRELQALLGAKYFDLASLNKLYWGVWTKEKTSRPWRQALLMAFKGADFITFYRSFLDFEINQLEQFTKDPTTDIPLKHPLFEYMNPKRFKTTSYLNYLEQLQQQVPALPRGLFDDKPTYHPKVSGIRIDTHPDEYADWFVETYRYPKADYQSFYNKLPESIEIPSDELETLRKQDVHQNKSDQELQKKYHYQEMSKIRKEQTKDQAIWWMVKYMLNQTACADNQMEQRVEELSLREVYISGSQKKAEQESALKQSKREKGNMDDNLTKHTSLYRLEIPVSHHTDAKIQLGDLLDYRAKRRDPLVETLQSYDPNKHWDNQTIDHELFSGKDAYLTIQRDEIWEKLFTFEKGLLTRYRNKKGYPESVYPEAFKHNGYPNFKTMLFAYYHNQITDEFKQTLNAFIDEKPYNKNRTFNKLEKYILTAVLLRNKFAHSQLPNVSFLQKLKEIGILQLHAKTTYSRSLANTLIGALKQLERN